MVDNQLQLINKIKESWGVNEFYVQQWLDLVNPNQELLDLALVQFDKRLGYRFFNMGIAPKNYLFNHQGLIQHTPGLCPNYVKSLPEDVYKDHLDTLIVADRKGRSEKDKFELHLVSYYAQIFAIFRFTAKKADINFALKLLHRKITHSSYPAARKKLRDMAKGFEPAIN